MGFDINRFQNLVDEELICTICSGVFQDPVQVSECEHAFCRHCITEWINIQPTCPLDRIPITLSELLPASRILKILLSRLQIKCDNLVRGCQRYVKLDTLMVHLDECEYKKPIRCEQGCGLIIPKSEMETHNCIRELQNVIQSQQQKMYKMRIESHQRRFVVGLLALLFAYSYACTGS